MTAAGSIPGREACAADVAVTVTKMIAVLEKALPEEVWQELKWRIPMPTSDYEYDYASQTKGVSRGE